MHPRRRELRARIAEEVFMYFAFWIAVSALPALAVSFVVVRVCQHLWLKLLSSRYPHLEFIRTDTVRTLLDTHRNQGIINVLLCVKGHLVVEEIKQHLTDHVVEKRDKCGQHMFPRLRHLLVSCWGNYAWDRNVPFVPDNHFIVANAAYRGRTVSDNNIQEYVSEIVSKYFPSDQPPWQFIIIPCASQEPMYYILVRVHHLLLTGKKSINIGDLLLVEQLKTSQLITSQPEYVPQSPLVKLFPTPSAIPELWEKINELLSNSWNEFVSEYDPVESPRALKSMPGVFHLIGLVMLSTVNALRGISKNSCERDAYETHFNVTSFASAIRRECKRRNLTISKVLLSPLITIDPRKWPSIAISTVSTITKGIFKMPLRVRDEFLALRELKIKGHVRQPNTLTWKYAGLAQLSARAANEAWQSLWEIYRAPGKLWTDTVGADDGKRHVLQTVSLCGRKVASWSRPISRAAIDRASRALGVSSTDIAIYAATEGLRTYFEQTHNTPPETVLATARAATEDFLFTFAEGNGKKYKKSQTGGMICVSLPMGASPRRIASVVENACNRQGALAAAWTAQARYGALTRAVPSPLARLTLNLLSRRYSVSYAEINSPSSAQQRKMLWGQTLDCVVYWRPPQANISMSLTVIQYADTIRLSVMADARLSPAHKIPAVRWPIVIDQLINKVDQEIARISAQAHEIPLIIATVAPQENSGEEEEIGKPSSSNLKPPAQQIFSPPLPRKRIIEN